MCPLGLVVNPSGAKAGLFRDYQAKIPAADSL